MRWAKSIGWCFLELLTLSSCLDLAVAQTHVIHALGDFNQTHSLADVVHIGDGTSDYFLPPAPSGTSWSTPFTLTAIGSVTVSLDHYQADNRDPTNSSFVMINGHFVGYLSNSGFLVQDLKGSNTLPVLSQSFTVPQSLRIGTNTVGVQSRPEGDDYDDLSFTNVRLIVPGNGCGRATYSGSYPSTPQAIGEPGGWHMSYFVSSNEGLELKNVFLGTRYMAASMSLPYLFLKTSAFPNSGNPQKCSLTPTSSPMPCGTRLVDFEVTPGFAPEIKATYEVDNISSNQDVCLQIIQDYQFAPPGNQGCEPSETLSCATFKPIVSYQYLSGASSETLTSLNTAQRLQFAVDALNPDFASAYAQASTMFRDCNWSEIIADLIAFPGGLTPRCLSIKPLSLLPPTFSLGATQTPGNPVQREMVAQAIANGSAGAWDNFHQTNESSILEPGAHVSAAEMALIPVTPAILLNEASPGCNECVHIHWRWGDYFQLIPGLSRFKGTPIIPPGSDQSVQIGILRPQTDLATFANPQSLTGSGVAFWYSATGHQAQDTFFSHGGFFSPPGLNVSYHGYVDSATCSGISGWVADFNRPYVPITVTLWDGATQIASTTASSPRPDVAPVTGDNGLHGFSLALPAGYSNGTAHNLQLRYEASATQVLGSPFTLTCGSAGASYTGYVDAASCNGISGWAADRSRPNVPIAVTLWDGATQIASTTASSSRPDVAPVTGDNGLHGFSLALPAAYANGIGHALQVHYEASPTQIYGASATLTCGGTAVSYTGYVDALTCTSIAGWAADRYNLNSSISVGIYDGSSLVLAVSASASRPDVGTFLGDNGLHGFGVPTPASLKDGAAHSITVRPGNSIYSPLTGVSPSLTCH